MKTVFKTIYYICLGLLVVTAVLLLVSVLPITGNFKVKIVLSGSMEPIIKTGSIVIVKPADDYRIGDIVTFQQKKDKNPITHRINEIKVVGSQPRYITKGDSNNAPDKREILSSDIMGKVLFSIPYLGYVVDFIQRPVGFAIFIIVPAVIIVSDEIKKIYAEIKKKKDSQ